MVIFNPGPLFKVKRGQPNLEVLITYLLLVLEICNVKLTCRKSWAGNFLMWSDLAFGPSFKVKGGQPNLKVLEVCNVKPTFRKSWAGNLLPRSLFIIASTEIHHRSQ